jgi:hypothetical protein
MFTVGLNRMFFIAEEHDWVYGIMSLIRRSLFVSE